MGNLAGKLRKTPTAPEVRLWRLIHPFRTGGFHFRKQVPIGRFVVDFACHAEKLVIEVDGDTHFTDAAMRADTQRDAFLRGEGYRVLRFTNVDVMDNPEGVYHQIGVTLGLPGF